MPIWDWLNIVLVYARSTILPVAALVVTAGAVAVVFSRLRPRDPPRAAPRTHPPRQSLSALTVLPPGVWDIEAEARAALVQFSDLAARHSVKLELAVPAGLTAGMDRHAFRELLHDLLVHALSHGPTHRVLLGAYQHDGQLHISVTDDGGAELTSQRAALRLVEPMAAALGATLGIDIAPGQGTTVILRVPTDGTPSAATPSIYPVKVWTSDPVAQPVTATTR